jgi:hypothetical protein
MFERYLRHVGLLATAIAFLVAVTATPVAAQTAGPAAKPAASTRSYSPPKTLWGDPDLQGIWNNGTTTPLERPAQLADRETLTSEEVEQQAREAAIRDDAPPRAGDVGFYNAEWWDRGKSIGRTSLLIDPAEGKLPPMTPEGAKIAKERQARIRFSVSRPEGPFNGPEDLSLTERCILFRPLPRLPTGYNNNYEIVQAPGYVAILQEQIHEVRVIPLDGRPHLRPSLPQWQGSARGRWEGNTLVVETVNFSDRTDFRGSGTKMHLVERFTRVSPDQIDYRFTVTDPTIWTRPWTAAIPMTKSDEPIFEYACHEGNFYSVENILSAAREAEKKATATATESSRR